MALYFIIPSNRDGGDEMMMFVKAATPDAALEHARVDMGDFPMDFEPVATVPKTTLVADKYWCVMEIAEPLLIAPPWGVIQWDSIPTTWWKATS